MPTCNSYNTCRVEPTNLTCVPVLVHVHDCACAYCFPTTSIYTVVGGKSDYIPTPFDYIKLRQLVKGGKGISKGCKVGKA